MIGQKKDKDPENCPLIKDLNFPKAVRLSLRIRPAPFLTALFNTTFCFTLYLLPPLLNPFLTNQARTRDSVSLLALGSSAWGSTGSPGDPHLQGLLRLLLLHESKSSAPPALALFPQKEAVLEQEEGLVWC